MTCSPLSIVPELATKEPPLDKETLRTLPPDLLRKLRKALIAARHDEIVELVETLRPVKPHVASRLRRMEDLFDYHGMLELLDPRNEDQNGR